jgi:beta-lactamase regulating signal transducer with metallopeptidase domain/multidrug resistance efflux pump
MGQVVELVTRLGPELLVGSTVLLAAGSAAVALARAPAKRQRIGEIAMAATLLWIALAVVPLPRIGWPLSSLRGAGIFERSVRDNRFAPTSSPPVVADDPMDPQARPNDTSRGQPLFAAPPPDAAVARESIPSVPFVPSVLSVPSVAPRERPVRPPNRLIARIRSALAVAYVIGSAACVLWLVFGRLLLARANRQASGPAPWLKDAYRGLFATRPARLRISSRIRRPFSFGVIRPTIMLPGHLTRPEDACTLRHVLRHEQAHVERRDAWGHLVMNLALPILYVNPLYWWLRGRIRFACELIADDWAAALGSKTSYAEDLLRLVRDHGAALAGPSGVMGVFRLRNPLARRMKMLLERDGRLSTRVGWAWSCMGGLAALVLVLAVASVIGSRFVAASDKPPRESDPAPSDSELDTSQSAEVEARLEVQAESVGDDVDVELDDADTQREGDADAPNATRAGQLGVPSEPPKQDPPGPANPQGRWRSMVVVEELVVSSQVDGVIRSIEVSPGVQVQKDQLLATIDNEIARIQNEAARLDVEASAHRAKNDVNVRYARKASDVAEADLQEAQAAVSRVPRAVSEFELARRHHLRARALLQVEQAEADFRLAQTESKKQLFQAQAAEALLSRHRIFSPRDGTIARFDRTVGEWVRAGEPICRIVRMGRVRVEVMLPAHQFNPEEIFGRDVVIEVERARGEVLRIPGKISFVSPVVEAGGDFRVYAELDNPTTQAGGYALRPGMQATMTLDQGTVPPHEQRIDPTRPGSAPKLSQEEIGYLTELVQAREATYQRIKALYDVGGVGGEAENEAEGRHQLCVDRARLALAQGDTQECLRQYEAAVKAAEKQVECVQAAYDAGAATLDRLLSAQERRAETKLKLSQLKRRLADPATRP